ncbi:MAG: YbjQ family protein [Candidatus Aenigmarchaeota archaeon]|nr:YbjQ family protein [Candidatus Aenigmarchaeota archaeon]
MAEIVLTTLEFVPGFEITGSLGVVNGNTVRSKHLGKDIMAGLKNLVGGEIQEYTEMLSESRQESLNRMVREAKKLGADGVVGIRFMTSAVTAGAAELLAFGTAVKLRKIGRKIGVKPSKAKGRR